MLIKAGANPYALGCDSFTVLHHACMEERTEVVKYLLKIAPDLLLLRGKSPLACLAPYLSSSVKEIYRLVPKLLCPPNILYTFQVFLDIPDCPSAIRFDICMLTVVYQVLISQRPLSDISTTLNVLKEFIATDIDPIIDVNGGVRVSSPRDASKEKYQLALVESIKSMDPTCHTWDRKIIQQCLLVSLTCFRYSSEPLLSMLALHLSSSRVGHY